MSLKDSFDGFGDTEFKNWVWEEYEDELKNQEMWGEELDVPDIGSSMRRYDHGQASSSEVKEFGVKIVFDKSEVSLDELEEGGEIREDIESKAHSLISKPVEYVEVSFVRDDSYEMWVIVGAESL
jgi:hypothetical protein